MKRIASVLFLTVLIVGCSSSQPKPLVDPVRPLHAPIVHVVICWQKDPGDAAERDALLNAADALRSIPGVLRVSTGTTLPSTRPVVDSTWDVAFLIYFADQQTMNGYLSNPQHLKLKRDVLDPNVRQIKVYDIQQK
jgi:hypothetical protein